MAVEQTTGVGTGAAALAPAARTSGRLAYYIELTKPRILVMILLTVIMAMVAVGTAMQPWTVLWTCLGTTMVAASASVLNQWIERERDAIMTRTSRRPLPTGRVAASQAAWMGWVLVIAGSLILVGWSICRPWPEAWPLGSCM